MLNEISIEILQKCPNRCIYCSSHSNPQATNIIPYNKIVSVIDDAKVLGCKTVCLSGGEPFLHPQILQIVEYISKKELACYIYSSGIYFNNEIYTSIPYIYIESIRGMAEKVIFNVEADSPELYNMIMGTDVGGFDLMKKSIKDCVSCGLNVEAHVVPMKCNYNRLKSIFEMCYKLGVAKVSVLRLVPQGRAKENSSLVNISSVDNNKVKETIRTLQYEYKDKVRIGLPLSDSSCRLFCKAGTEKINIRYDGNVYPCEIFKDDLINAKVYSQPGNIFDDSFLNIYKESQYLNNVRAEIETFKKGDAEESCFGQFNMK